jgi:hypothetical protein
VGGDESSEQQQLVEQIEERKPVKLVCEYGDLIRNPKDQIKWYFNKHRIRNVNEETGAAAAGAAAALPAAATLLNSQIKILNSLETPSSSSPHNVPVNHHFSIVQTLSHETNSTVSTLYIENFNLKYNFGRYRCQYRGLIKTVKIYPNVRNGKSKERER